MARNLPNAKNGFAHFMLKEIYEQPEAVRRVIAGGVDPTGRIVLPSLSFSEGEIRDALC